MGRTPLRPLEVSGPEMRRFRRGPVDGSTIRGGAKAPRLKKSDAFDGSGDHEYSSVVGGLIHGVDEESLPIRAVVQGSPQDDFCIQKRDFHAAALALGSELLALTIPRIAFNFGMCTTVRSDGDAVMVGHSENCGREG